MQSLHSHTAQARPGCAHARKRAAFRGATCIVPRAVATEREQPAWTGEGPLSWFVNLLINTPAIYNVMKVAARQAIKGGAEKQGVQWDAHVKDLQRSLPELQAIQAEITNPAIEKAGYPWYYVQPFHAYDQGNLCWLAAQEVDPATYAMSLRTYKTESLTPEQAFDKLRCAITDTYKAYMKQHGLQQPKAILDIGCATGMSTRWLASQFPGAATTGMDLSPYFLAVAERVERRKPEGSPRIQYVHGLAEATGLSDASVDLVSFQFVIHECPAEVIESFLVEAQRILRPGGVLLITDNNPRSATIQNLPPVLFTLMKSTEPHSDSYFSYDLEAAMERVGLVNVSHVPSDHRHRTVLATKA